MPRQRVRRRERGAGVVGRNETAVKVGLAVMLVLFVVTFAVVYLLRGRL
jgi:hypothetical protein